MNMKQKFASPLSRLSARLCFPDLRFSVRLLLCLFSIAGLCAVTPSFAYAGAAETTPSVSGAATETAPSVSGVELPVTEPILISGKFHREDGRFMMTGVHGETIADTVVLNLSDKTRILNAQSGMPVDKDALKEGETVYAYISQAMTLSLPPQSNANLILCQIPADYNVPSLETVAKMTRQEASTFLLTTVRGNHYLIDSSTALTPYLTKNIVTVSDLLKGGTCLIWAEPRTSEDTEIRKAQKVMIFPSADLKKPSGPASDPFLADGN